MLEPTATGSSLINTSSASIASSVRRVADGDVGVMGEAGALIGVNSSFTRARRLLLERCMSPPVGLAGDIVPLAVCKLNTGVDAKGGKEMRRGRRGRDGIAGMIGLLRSGHKRLRCLRKETDVGVQAVAYGGMGKVNGYGLFLCRRRQCIVNRLDGGQWALEFGGRSSFGTKNFGKTTDGEI